MAGRAPGFFDIDQRETSKSLHRRRDCEPTDPAFRRSDDRLREAIHCCEALDAATFCGLLCRPYPGACAGRQRSAGAQSAPYGLLAIVGFWRFPVTLSHQRRPQRRLAGASRRDRSGLRERLETTDEKTGLITRPARPRFGCGCYMSPTSARRIGRPDCPKPSSPSGRRGRTFQGKVRGCTLR